MVGGVGLVRMVSSMLHLSLLPSARDIDLGGGINSWGFIRVEHRRNERWARMQIREIS
jgi:hypothetical protein